MATALVMHTLWMLDVLAQQQAVIALLAAGACGAAGLLLARRACPIDTNTIADGWQGLPEIGLLELRKSIDQQVARTRQAWLLLAVACALAPLLGRAAPDVALLALATALAGAAWWLAARLWWSHVAMRAVGGLLRARIRARLCGIV